MLDFRNAKTMAGSLRKALAAQQITITHSQSLELIAQAFGLAGWNALSAKIEAERTPSAPPATQDKTAHCSFCGKPQHDVQVLIAGPQVNICSECVGLCDGVLFDQKLAKAVDEARSNDQESDPAAAAVKALSIYSDEQLETLRSSSAGWLGHVEWSLRQVVGRLEGGEPMPWRPDQVALRRGWTRDPLAGKSKDEIAAHRAELEARGREIRGRLELVDKVLAERRRT